MEKINYQLVLDKKIAEFQKNGIRPRLLLHCCCAPCSSYVMEYLSTYMDITCYYYNPNISPEEEYTKRADELLSLIGKMPLAVTPEAIIAEYDPESFEAISAGRENEAEGGARCFECYRLRLGKTAEYVKRAYVIKRCGQLSTLVHHRQLGRAALVAGQRTYNIPQQRRLPARRTFAHQHALQTSVAI